MTKNKTILTSLILAIFLISVISLASAETYTFSLREGESTSQEFSYINTNANTGNITFSIENIQVVPGTPSNDRVGEDLTFGFTQGVFNDVAPSGEITDTLTLTIADSAIVTSYTADIVETTVEAGGAIPVPTIIHTLEIEVRANSAPVITGLENFNIEVGTTQETIVTLTDADSDTLIVDLVNEPSGMTIADNADGTWTINWAPTSSTSETIVNLTVSDGLETTFETFSALAYIAGTNLQIPEINLGSASQHRELLTQSFTLTNAGSEAIQNLNVQIASSDLNFTIVQAPSVSIAPGSSTTFTMTIDIPLSQNSGTENIGSLIFNYNGIVETKTVSLTTKSLIRFYDDAEYEVNNDDEENLDQGENIDVDPEDMVTIKFRIESLADIEFDKDDIEATVECDEFDYEEDDTSTEDLDDDGDKTNEFKFEIEVPYDADEDNNDASIIVEAEDENGAIHTLELVFNIEVDKPRHRIRIIDASFLKSTVEQGSKVQLEIEIENAGTEDEERVYIEIKSSQLNINERVGPFELDEEDDLTRTIILDIPDNAAEDDYVILIETFYNMNRESDETQLTLTVYNDEITPIVTPGANGNDDETVVITPDQDDTLINPAYGEPIRKGIFGENSITILLIILIVVVAVLVVIIILPTKK